MASASKFGFSALYSVLIKASFYAPLRERDTMVHTILQAGMTGCSHHQSRTEVCVRLVLFLRLKLQASQDCVNHASHVECDTSSASNSHELDDVHVPQELRRQFTSSCRVKPTIDWDTLGFGLKDTASVSVCKGCRNVTLEHSCVSPFLTLPPIVLGHQPSEIGHILCIYA